MCKENYNKMTWEEKLDKIIQNPEYHGYRELRKIVTGIYGDKKISEENIVILEKKIKKIERLFDYKRIGPFLSIISYLASATIGYSLSSENSFLLCLSLILTVIVATIVYIWF